MSKSRRNWNELVGAIYDAALDDALWTPAIGGIMELVGASQSMLFSPAVNPATSQPFLLNQHIQPDLWNLYTQHYWRYDIWSQRAIQANLFSQGACARGEALVSREELRRTEVYQDCLRLMDVEVFLSNVLFDDSKPELAPRTHLTLFRSVGTADFGQHDERFIRRLSPHLQRALRIRQQMGHHHETCILREAALDQMTQAILLLDDKGRVLYANRHAEAIFREGCGPIVVNHRLTAATPNSAARLKEALAQAALNIGSNVRLENPARQRQWILTFSPLRIIHPGTPSAAKILALISTPERTASEGLPLFAQTYRLTPAETRVLQCLLEQQSTHDIAEVLTISINTLRTHLKNLFAKTCTANQRELVRFFLSHPAIGRG
ncbi:MAG: helix-turn-helix transcriptional regulator [Methylococcaceae bacterium]